MAGLKSFSLVALLVLMSTMESESRVARKDLGLDLGGVGLGIGTGIGIGLGLGGSGAGSGAGAGSGSGSGSSSGSSSASSSGFGSNSGSGCGSEGVHMRGLMQGQELGQDQAATKEEGQALAKAMDRVLDLGRVAVNGPARDLVEEVAMERAPGMGQECKIGSRPVAARNPPAAHGRPGAGPATEGDEGIKLDDRTITGLPSFYDLPSNETEAPGVVFDHEVGLSDHSVPQKGANKMYAKNWGKRRWLSGPEPRHTANGSERPKTGLQTGKMAYDHET
ncbi:hypothetical protein HYC85_003544 [Camellia sinensis]|uniref:Uncharacterized protein n=1 Tax=Camellia sinensis TaxID=4442 RepID=A0A7J7HUK4_CAMSI|nr:hypothetical protein HYC85_003544 [Camellia sinensis]